MHKSACLVLMTAGGKVPNLVNNKTYICVPIHQCKSELKAVSCLTGRRVEVIMGTGKKMFQLRNPPLPGEWSLPHHQRRMLGRGDHNKIRAIIMMSLL